jgi:hypothetical protein
MSLQPASSFDDLFAIGMAIHRELAYDPVTGARLHCSYGHRRSGRPTRYWVLLPTCNFRLYETTIVYEDASFGLTAHSEEEAIAKANQRLDKMFGALDSQDIHVAAKEE